MSNLIKPPPLATVFYGDVTLERGSDIECFGHGDLSVNRNLIIYGTTESNSNKNGSLIISGGAYIDKSLYIKKDLTVSFEGVSYLNRTVINTDYGYTTITGNSGILINVNDTSGVFINNNLTLSSSIGSLSILSGQNSNSAINLRTTHINGGIKIESNLGGIDLQSNAGVINIKASGNNNQNISIISEANNTQSIIIKSTGGILIDSNSIINIGTQTPNIPINIGNKNSNVTINGNLYVKGDTTSINKQIVTIDDNIIVVNNAPKEMSDGGFAVKRYQTVSDISEGELINDVPEETGTIGNINNSTQITLDSTANTTDEYYKNWWVKITSGQGSEQIRKIKSYIGSTKLATIYSTIDQSSSNIFPPEGLDFTTIPNQTSTYALYPCQYVMNIWDESKNEFAFICTPTSPTEESEVQVSHYSNLQVNNLTSDGIFTNFLNDTVADKCIYVTLTDDSVNGLIANDSSNKCSINAFPEISGIYLLFVKPKTDNTRAHAIFMIGKIGGGSLPGTVVRLISVKGVNGEHLDLVWNNIGNQKPELYYRPLPTNGNTSITTEYKIKLVTI